MYVYIKLSETAWVLFEGGEPPVSSSEVELAELMERFHVNAVKYSSLICHNSLCSTALLLKNTLITLLSHTLTFTSP